MTDDTYNGWTNRETWATTLHIDNDEGLHNYRLELCRDAVENPDPSEYLTTDETRQITLENTLRDWVEEMAESFYSEPAENASLGGMFNDIGSLWRINYREIAENWLQEYEVAA